VSDDLGLLRILVRALDDVIAMKLSDGPTADGLRDLADPHWQALSEEERDIARGWEPVRQEPPITQQEMDENAELIDLIDPVAAEEYEHPHCGDLERRRA
jgi:hypothetical protein